MFLNSIYIEVYIHGKKPELIYLKLIIYIDQFGIRF